VLFFLAAEPSSVPASSPVSGLLSESALPSPLSPDGNRVKLSGVVAEKYFKSKILKFEMD